MNTVTVRILVFLLSLFILITVFSQISIQFQDSYVTETAVLYSSAEKVLFQGVYIRNETPVYGGASGVLSYPNADGSKIANGSVVAYVYKSENDIYVNQQIEKLKEEVKLLESAQNPGTTEAAQPEFISSLIEEEYQTIAFLIAEDDLDALAEERKKLQTLMNIYKIIINEETDFNDAIDSLNSRIEQLEAKKREPVDAVTIDSTGYFISHTDGFESKLSLDNIDALTADDIKDVISGTGASRSSRAIGKMVDGYEWKMAGIVNANAADFRVGSSIKVKFASTPDRLNAVIEDLIGTDNPDESMIILSCDKLTYNLVQRRVERVELILNDYDGIRVPRGAIRFNEKNEKGVYILLGQRIAFKKIEPVYECEEYILSQITSDADYISVYDDIIVEGEISEDLYVSETTADEPEEEINYSSTSVTDGENAQESETSEDNSDIFSDIFEE